VAALLIDVASYQHDATPPLDLAAAKAAGFGAVNVKLSQGAWYTWRDAPVYLNRARDLGLGVATFHWLDNSASGAEQARIVLGLMRQYGVLAGTAHQCDCEDTSRPATWTIWRDYVTAMQDGLGRHIINYTGDWWWTARGWNGAALTPYLWAAPNHGYDAAYPGDASPDWRAGYGGWSDYSALQYAVGPVPAAGGADLSKTAFRDPAVWAALTGGDTMLADDPDGRWEFPRVEAIAHLLDTIADPRSPEHGKPVELVAAIKDIQANARRAAGTPAPVAMSQADRDAIVAGVAQLLGGKLDQVLDRLGRAGHALET
jgi:hypothetical protein